MSSVCSTARETDLEKCSRIDSFNSITSHYFSKWTGTHKKAPFPQRPRPQILVSSFVQSFLGIGMLSALTWNTNHPDYITFVVGSFGATAVLVFGVPESPFSQPRNVLGGNVLSAFIGVSVRYIFSAIIKDEGTVTRWLWLATALSVSLSILAMQLTLTVHPPGGAAAFLACSSPESIISKHYLYLAAPILTGSCIFLVIALALGNIGRSYPLYWISPVKDVDEHKANQQPDPAMSAEYWQKRCQALELQIRAMEGDE